MHHRHKYQEMWYSVDLMEVLLHYSNPICKNQDKNKVHMIRSNFFYQIFKFELFFSLNIDFIIIQVNFIIYIIQSALFLMRHLSSKDCDVSENVVYLWCELNSHLEKTASSTIKSFLWQFFKNYKNKTEFWR